MTIMVITLGSLFGADACINMCIYIHMYLLSGARLSTTPTTLDDTQVIAYRVTFNTGICGDGDPT